MYGTKVDACVAPILTKSMQAPLQNSSSYGASFEEHSIARKANVLHKSMENLGGLSINKASIEQLSTNRTPMGSSVYFSNCSAGEPSADVSQLEVAHVRIVAESVINKCTKNLGMEQKPRNPH